MSQTLRRLLMVSPHFPPDTSAGTHRVRLLAPHLAALGWRPTVVTLQPGAYEGRLDPDLAALVPADLEVVRAAALPTRWTRPLGVGDLGLRALPGLYRACRRRLASERFDAIFITLYPTYPALLGGPLKRRFGLRFVLDYQDPWIGAWGDTVGGGPGGAPDWKSRASRRLARHLEPRAVHAADALTAVSAGTCEAVLARYPERAGMPWASLPLGGEPDDFARLRAAPERPNGFFDAADGRLHLCYVGTLLPLGLTTLRGLLAAVARLERERPAVARRLALHFFGTSNQTDPRAAARVLPVAAALGLGGGAVEITEVAPRLDYLDALRVLTQAGGILLLGSSEPHYSASKLYPGLLAGRPLLAAYHRDSDVVGLLRRVAREPAARLIIYGTEEPAEALADRFFPHLVAMVEDRSYDPSAVDRQALAGLSAAAMAGRLARLLDGLCAAKPGSAPTVGSAPTAGTAP